MSYFSHYFVLCATPAVLANEFHNMSDLWPSAAQESIENLELNGELDLEGHGKLHILYGGTKVVQHSPPGKNSPGLKGWKNHFQLFISNCIIYVICL